jgi:L-threonylcarbamoyladenylate synthase
MAVRIFKVNIHNKLELDDFLKNELEVCIDILHQGGTIVFPTETLYGLGADIHNASAIERVITLKGRPENMPIAVACSGLEHAKQVAEVTRSAEYFINNCLPKPVTILLKVRSEINRKLTAGSHLIGLRFPDEPVTKALLESFGPITATSANLHGAGDPVKADQAIESFGENVDLYLDTGPSKLAKPSTVVDISSNTIKIIRYGACSGDELKRCLTNI